MKKYLLIAAVILAAFAAWIAVFPTKNPLKKWFGKPQATPAPDGAIKAQEIILPGAGTSFFPKAQQTDYPGFPLNEGSRGTYVAKLQAALNDKYGSSLVVDGIFGPKTYKAVSAQGFAADGVSYSEYLLITS